MSRTLRSRTWPDHPALATTVPVTVPFQDADPTGVAWHGNYFRYYDQARVDLLARLGFGYREMAAYGQIWPIVDTRVRYLKSIAFGTTVNVYAQIVEWEFRLRIYYRITDQNDTLLNEAFTIQVPVDAATENLIIGAPAHLIERIDALIDSNTGSAGS
ncbi:MAG: acyl-CoA thioesterase [Pseudomonadales bacterium]